MAAFSRGCSLLFFRPVQPQFLTSTLLKTRSPRFFSTNSFLNAPPKPRTNLKSKTLKITVTKSAPIPNKTSSPAKNAPPNPIQNGASPSTSQANYISHLASKSTPTLLYTAPSQTIYNIASYTGAFFCTIYTGYCYESVVIHGPEDLATLVTFGFSAICLFTGCVGAYLLMGPSRVVKQIFAVPTSMSRSSRGRAKLATGADMTPLNLEIHLSSLIPKFLLPITPAFLQPIKIAPPNSITLSQPLSPLLISTGSRSLTPAEKQAQIEAAEKRRHKWKTSVMTRPFQELGQASGEIWEGTKRVLSREGFARIRVKDKGNYKLDVRGGWMLVDGGKGSLDRLCKIQRA